MGCDATIELTNILRADNLPSNQGNVFPVPDHLLKEYQKSFRSDKASNAVDHNLAPSASGIDPPETRRRNQSVSPANVSSEDVTDERVWCAPIPNDISS